ncbi:MAG: glycosyltransferase family 2 protein [Flavobacteriales bacterium]|nr:glycosyltransferase family 2 protein [Flavobacteriales bacterium]
MSISVIIPVFNEERNIETLYARLLKVFEGLNVNNFEILYVNDGSTDRGLEVIKQLARKDAHVRYLDLSRNFGHQIAVTAGLDRCTGERILIIDADLQDPPELIPELLNRMDEGYDVVYAKRSARKGESFLKKITAKVFYRMLNSITNVHIPLDTGDFRVISRRVVEVLKQMPEREKFIRGQIAWMGFDQTYVEYERDQRQEGDTGYTWRKMIRFALDGITSFSDFPLKMATLMGFVVSFFSFILMLYALYSRFILKDYEPGWTSLILSVLFIGGIQLIAIGIIGEYIGRISNNVKDRPLYLIKETSNSKENEDNRNK